MVDGGVLYGPHGDSFVLNNHLVFLSLQVANVLPFGLVAIQTVFLDVEVGGNGLLLKG